MTSELISLFVIVLIAALCPIVAKLVPNKLVPETVFLLVAGALLGPYMADVIILSDSVDMLSELGMAFLFLLAGYEIEPKNITGPQGKRGLVTWLVTIALAFLVVRFLTDFSVSGIDGIAVAIALTTTALGALMPILKERGLLGSELGDSVLAYGTWGELGPIFAMALLLSSRHTWQTFLILVAFVALAVVVAVIPARAKKAGTRLYRFMQANADSTSQTMMRATVLLLVGLVTVSAVFELDVVLGAFAAGFVLRHVLPEGDESLELKLEGIGYGFLIPVFFIVSGAKIDLTAVAAQPVMLVAFIAALLLIRMVPIAVSLSTSSATRSMPWHNRLSVAFYCTTALPLIVAVTSMATKAGAMPASTASVLVAAGAVTVFLMPLLANITYRVVDAKPIEAAREIKAHPDDLGHIIHDHVELERAAAKDRRQRLREVARSSLGPWGRKRARGDFAVVPRLDERKPQRQKGEDRRK